MLRLLRVRNFALIDELELAFTGGLNLLSGETGAGKSLIVDALALIAGSKASSETIRSGERRARIEAVFDTPPHLDLTSIGIDPEDELVLRREISSDNRNRVFINSQPSTVAGLRKIAPALLDIHGQHEQQSLLDARRQLDLIDRAAGEAGLVSTVRSLFAATRELEDELASLETTEAEADRRAEQLRFERDEIERAAPEHGEADALRERIHALQHSEKLFEAAAGGYQRLYEAEGSVLEQLATLRRTLQQVSRYDRRLQPILAHADAAHASVEELAFALRDYLGRLDAEPGRMDRLQERLSRLERLHRKYGPDLTAHLETVIQELDTIGLRNSRRDDVSRRLTETRTRFREAAGRLGDIRRSVSARLEEHVTGEIQSLAMPRAVFRIDWEATSPRASGCEACRFVLAPNPGEAAAPLASIASGGELSRTMLALRTVLTGHGETGTLVFDEVDAGIGGEAAETVGRKLKALAASYQVLCVTHVAQIARFADRHSRIDKRVFDGRTATRVETLAGEARIEELARMMSGPAVTDAARRHVRELLARS